MKRTHTLASIAAEAGRDKRTVQGWFGKAKEKHGILGEIDTNCNTRFFDDDERAILLSYAGSDRPAPKESEPVLNEGFIQTSALAPIEIVELDAPQGFDPNAMVRYFDGVAGLATNTDQLLLMAKAALGAAENAMDAKLEAQKDALLKTENDRRQLQAMVNETTMNLKIKAAQAKQIAEAQTRATEETQQAFSRVMELGKPSASQQS